MSIVIGSMILCVIGTFILMWICSMLMGDGGLYVACFLFVALMFALLVKIYIKQGEIQENQAEILERLPCHQRKHSLIFWTEVMG